jgi:hypothetical protein
VRTDDGQSLGVEIRHVHRIANGSFEERGPNRLRDLDADAFLRFRRGSAQMRSENEGRQIAQRRVERQRLRLKNIERGRSDMPRAQRLRQRNFVDKAAARAIDHAYAAFRFSQAPGVEQVMRLRGERRMQGDEIRGGQQIIELIDQLDLKRARPGRRQIWIERHNPHAESDGAPAQLAADSPHADDAERLVEELDAFQIFAVPLSAAQERIGLRDFARRAQQ